MYRAYVSRYLNSAVFTERCTHLKILSADTQIAERSIHSYVLIIIGNDFKHSAHLQLSPVGQRQLLQ